MDGLNLIFKAVIKILGMVKVVLKKDERREDFDREKLRRGVMRAAERAEIDEARAKELADKVADKVEVQEREEMKAEDIRNILLEELDREERAIADAFRAFKKEQ